MLEILLVKLFSKVLQIYPFGVNIETISKITKSK